MCQRPGQAQKVFASQLVMGFHVILVLADGQDLFLHLRVRESQRFLDAVRLGDDRFQVVFPHPVEQGETALDDPFDRPVIYETFVQDPPVQVFPVLRDVGMCLQDPLGGVGAGKPFAPDGVPVRIEVYFERCPRVGERAVDAGLIRIPQEIGHFVQKHLFIRNSLDVSPIHFQDAIDSIAGFQHLGKP